MMVQAKVHLKIIRQGHPIVVEIVRQDVSRIGAVDQMLQTIHGLREASRRPGFDLQGQSNVFAHQFQDFCIRTAFAEAEVAARIRRVQEEILKGSNEPKAAQAPSVAAPSVKEGNQMSQRVSQLEAELKNANDQLKQKEGDLQKAKSDLEVDETIFCLCERLIT